MPTYDDGVPVSGAGESTVVGSADFTQLDGLQYLVKKQTTSDTMESTDYRTGSDVRELVDAVKGAGLGCDAEKKKNVMQNAMGYSSRRDRYNT